MSGNRPLEERIERLERELDQVRSELRQVSAEAASKGERSPTRENGSNAQSPAEGSRESAGSGNGRSTWQIFSEPRRAQGSGEKSSAGSPLEWLKGLRSGEWWLARLGIGLVLFGVVLLFGYSVQRGWLTPVVQVGIGLGVGFALLFVGLYVYEDRRYFSRVLLGGGVGALYITGFAAFQVYSLVPQVLAFGFMIAVTLLAVALSVRQDAASLSVIGALGGLGTPFLLYTGSGSVPGLVVYVCLILAGTATVYLYKDWASLLVVSSVGGWLALATGYTLGFLSVGSGGVAEADFGSLLALQLGVTFAWLLFWLVPGAREVLRNPGLLSSRRRSRYPVSSVTHAHVVLSPLLALGFTAAIWLPGLRNTGWIALGGAALYALAAYGLYRLMTSGLTRTHGLIALLLFTIALPLLLRGEVLYLALAVEATALHLAARRLSDRLVSILAHGLFCVVLAWLILRLPPMITLFSYGESGLGSWSFVLSLLVHLGVIALAVAASAVMPASDPRIMYRIVAHIALLLLMWRVLSTLPGGVGWVAVAWAVYAAGIFVAGLRLDLAWIVRVGLVTLFAVVGKLFVIDLASIDPFWRVLLFLGSGVLFLALSYYLRALWRPGTKSGKSL